MPTLFGSFVSLDNRVQRSRVLFCGGLSESPCLGVRDILMLKTVYSTIPFGCLAMLAAFWIKDPSHLLNNHVAVKQEREVLGRVKQPHASKQAEYGDTI